MFTDYEKKLYKKLYDSFQSDEFLVCFDLPEDKEEKELLLSAARHFEDAGIACAVVSPDLGYDYLELELMPQYAYHYVDL
ncbi:hypothetical protein EDD70_1045 [Hydrogenoanaerobacterium saccharovorans]|uniref:Uncharacterized protein n=1 Tax=Hydrogenoanaerobacterium saccharovorans TaxID=474960 RepID=A0A1H8A3D7_9FIRM|nr:hypothetical protein [Hydrogenoanaerobacterium saccharovorans]RPF48230.1 hypothetical protein EDD70_1045 [Hydrogenoanaerobacterium saccharovorans]SEM64424.1 hypothetical protein SAMN05216180_1046 [Hydrogenoanaerobacterium saccharovorans]